MKTITLSVNGQRHNLACRENSSDLAVAQQVFERRDYDTDRLARGADLQTVYDAMIARGETPLILDLGANIGASSLWFHLRWPKARVLAVEPASDNVELLRRNCAPYPMITVIEAAAASQDGFARVTDPTAEAWAYRTETGAGGDIPARSVASLLAEAVPALPFVCKIDIEGAEAEVFSKDTAWFDAFALVVIEPHDWMLPGTASSCNFLKAHTARNRDLAIGGENLFSIRNGD